MALAENLPAYPCFSADRRLICGAITLITIVALTPIFEQLPEAILGAVVISAVWGTFNVAELRRIYQANRNDFAAAAVALIGVCVTDLLPGLVLAVLTSFTLLVYRASRPGMPTLGRLPGERYYVSTETDPDARPPEGVVVIRLDAPLIFANVDAFRAHDDLDRHRGRMYRLPSTCLGRLRN